MFTSCSCRSDQDFDNGGLDSDEAGRDGNDEGLSEKKIKKAKKEFHYGEEGPIQKNQIRDKAAKNKESGENDERKITNISQIKNKIRRNEEWLKLKREKKKEKRARQDARRKEAEALGDEAPPKLIPHTIDGLREYDETTVGGKEGTEEDEEVEHDITNDEFASYFSKSYEPKVLITCGDNPHSRTIAFVKELTRMIPNSEPKWRKNTSIKKMVKDAVSKEYTDIIIINEDNRNPNGLVVTHLPEGPTAHFKVSNDLRKDWRQISAHRPEVILNNFTTRLGHGV